MYDTALLWLRRDLRLHDNAALYHAARVARQVVVVFIFDSEILQALPRHDRRVEFIWESLREIKYALEAQGSSLIVRHGLPVALIPQLAAQYQAEAVYCNRDYEPLAMQRDAAVAEQLSAAGRHLHSYKDQVIFECDEVLTQAGTPFEVYTPYKNAWLKKLTAFYLQPYPDHAGYTQIPSQAMPDLATLGFERTNLSQLAIKPGSLGAAQMWEDFVERIDDYQQARDYPFIKGPSYLSVHLRFGTCSIRQLVSFAYHHGGAGAQTWLSELIWRDFYHQVLWHCPQLAQGRTYKTMFDDIAWPNPDGHFEAWCTARTGYPIIDAAMRQLNQTGYMHNRLRMIAASFLVKDLHVDWRWGEAYFATHLIDYDLAANNGGWQWSASTGCDAQPWFRIFNPIMQSQKFDREGRFIRRYLPELAALPVKYIHTPWQLSADQQQDYSMQIGCDYPAPIIDHAAARAVTLAIFKSYGMTGQD